MLPFVLESVGWGSERCGIEPPPGGRAMMRERHRPISPRVVHAPRGLRRQGKKERRTLRSRRVGEDWTEKISIDVSDGSNSTPEGRRTFINSAKTGSKSSILPSKNG